MIRPCIPAAWPGLRIHYRLADGLTRCDIQVENPHGGSRVVGARLDGQALTPIDGAARVVLPPGEAVYRIEIALG